MPAGAAVAAAGALLRIDGFDASRLLELRLLDGVTPEAPFASPVSLTASAAPARPTVAVVIPLLRRRSAGRGDRRRSARPIAGRSRAHLVYE